MTNLVILVGRIARDPETRTTQGGTGITSISVVTDRPARKDGKTYKDENGYTAKDSEFHRITCFNGLGQNVAKYCTEDAIVPIPVPAGHAVMFNNCTLHSSGVNTTADRNRRAMVIRPLFDMSR